MTLLIIRTLLFLYPDKEQGQVASTVSPDAHQVEDVSNDKDEELRELMSPLRNQTPTKGEWMEPTSMQSATATVVPTIYENSCSVHGMKVLQQYSRKRNNKNRNRMRILRMIRYTDQRRDLSNSW